MSKKFGKELTIPVVFKMILDVIWKYPVNIWNMTTFMWVDIMLRCLPLMPNLKKPQLKFKSTHLK